MSREISKLRKYVVLLEEKVIQVTDKMKDRYEKLVLKNQAADFVNQCEIRAIIMKRYFRIKR